MSKQKNKSDFYKAKSMELLLKSTIHSNNRENTGNFSSLKLKNAANSPAIQHRPKSRSVTLQRLLRELQCYMTANLHGSSEKYVTFKKGTVLGCYEN